MTLLEHLHSRYLDTNLHKVWVDEQSYRATFPLYSVTGTLVGYHRYYPHGSKDKPNDPRDGKYFTKSFGKGFPVWGIESWYSSNTLFVLEGLFDAARVTSSGYSAVSVFSNNVSKSVKSWLQFVRTIRPIVAVCDNDEAGKKLAKYGHISVVVTDGKDLSESSDIYVQQLLSAYA